MEGIPATVVTAVVCSAAAGKNPWVPLAALLLIGGWTDAPSWIMSPSLHEGLHGIAAPGIMMGVGGVFAVLALLSSLSDKLPWVENWLTPLSTWWKPIGAVVVASLIGTSAMSPEAAAFVPEVTAADGGAILAGSAMVLSIVGGGVFGYLSAIGKTGIRLLLSVIPIPGVRFLHSLADDFFAVGATFAGVALGDTVIVAVAAGIYLLVGLAFGPYLSRLAGIHMRIGKALFMKIVNKAADDTALPEQPKWLKASLSDAGMNDALAMPAYTWNDPELGRFRSGWAVLGGGEVWFATRYWWRTRVHKIPLEKLARIGYAETTTSRTLLLVEPTESGGLLETQLTFFPATEEQVETFLARGASGAGLVRVKPESNVAREAAPGFLQAGNSVRYRPVSEAGDLRIQGLVTVATAGIVGFLTGGIFVPIGAGYFLSPFKKRGVLGLFLSGYLSLAVLSSIGFGWPMAVAYAVLFNLVALRDLARNTIKARLEGFVDKRAFLPVVAGRVWVASEKVTPGSRWTESDALPITDGPWRATLAAVTSGSGSLAPAE